MRLNRYLALCGLGSRRKVEELIKNGSILVNQQPGQLATQVNPSDVVFYRGQKISPQKLIYIVLNKPLGVTSSTADSHAEKLVTQLVPLQDRLFPVGRLDKNSSGLMLLTNDGNLAHQLAHPRFHLPKTYSVTVRGQLTAAKINQLKKGLFVNGQPTLPSDVTVLSQSQFSSVIEITLYRGLKRQIRLAAAALHLHVESLIRLSIGPIKLGTLKSGQWRYLTDSELQKLNYSANSLKRQ